MQFWLMRIIVIVAYMSLHSDRLRAIFQIICPDTLDAPTVKTWSCYLNETNCVCFKEVSLPKMDDYMKNNAMIILSFTKNPTTSQPHKSQKYIKQCPICRPSPATACMDSLGHAKNCVRTAETTNSYCKVTTTTPSYKRAIRKSSLICSAWQSSWSLADCEDARKAQQLLSHALPPSILKSTLEYSRLLIRFTLIAMLLKDLAY